MLVTTQSPNFSTSLIAAKTVGDAIVTWVSQFKSIHTQKAYKSDIFQFLKICFDCQQIETVLAQDVIILGAIKLESIQGFVTQLVGLNRAKNTIGRKVTAIKSLFSFLQKSNVIPSNVGSLIKTSMNTSISAKRFIEKATMSDWLAAPSEETAKEKRDRIAIKTLYYTALRVNELCSLSWENITVKNDGTAIIQVLGKGDKTRTILIPKELVDDLNSIKKEDSIWLFNSRQGGQIKCRQLLNVVKESAVRHGLSSEVSPHWLRHSHASNALDNGASLLLVKNQLGHASIATTERYLHAKVTDSSAMYL